MKSGSLDLRQSVIATLWWSLWLTWYGVGGLSGVRAADLSLPAFDFTERDACASWTGAHDVAPITCTTTGMVVNITGSDPYFHGPARNYPVGQLLWLHVRLKSEQAGVLQVFYYTSGPSEAQSVRIIVPGGHWYEGVVPVPALGSGYSLRIDPPGTGGTCVLGRLWFEERTIYPAPDWPKPEAPALGADALETQSGVVRLRHHPSLVGGFEVHVDNLKAAVGNSAAQGAYIVDGQARWFPWGNGPANDSTVRKIGEKIQVNSTWTDSDGGHWILDQLFEPGAADTLEVVTTVIVDQDRAALYLPVFTLLPGVGSFGTNKNQGLLAGVEYLENEPSSSEADLTGLASARQVPDTLKITLPLMAVQAEDRYVGLVWEPGQLFCAVHDSPDRIFKSGGHLLGILFPGSDGVNRDESSLIPYKPETLAANQPLRLRARIIGGRGNSIVPAVQHYVRLAGLPPVPQTGYNAQGYFELAAHGWLDSRIRETNLFRHAYWSGFNPQPAADAATWMSWLSEQVDSPALAARLTDAAAGAISVLARANYNAAQIGHVRYPLPALVFGAVLDCANQAEESGRSLLSRFEPDGSVHYQPTVGGTDYGKTYWAPDANGLTATIVLSLLEAATFSGDPALLQEGLRKLRAMDKFRYTVPRGAQTWEIPLHTPDILASAYLVRVYTLGYELSGDPAFLETARYWAWTGVPFVYLTPPTSQPVGLYSTIPVLGASGYIAPVWIGLPVQWCGLVYADAIRRFARWDASGPWKQIADGVAAAGVQHTWPLSDTERQGLLPDSYQLRLQLSDGPAINPATLQPLAISLFGRPAPYEFHTFPAHRLLLHAPGSVTEIEELSSGISFHFQPWSRQPVRLLMNGVWQTPILRINHVNAALGSPHQYSKAEGRLVLFLTGPADIEISHPALATLNIRPSPRGGSVDLSWPLGASNLRTPDLWKWAEPTAPQ